MLHHGPVRVPADARSGQATIRVKLSSEPQFKLFPTDIEVTLVKADENKLERPHQHWRKSIVEPPTGFDRLFPRMLPVAFGH